MSTKMLNPKQKEQLVQDLKECETIREDIEKAKLAKVQGVEILEQRLNECIENLKAKYSQYGGRHQ